MANVNFKKFEVTGTTKAEALSKLSDVFVVEEGAVSDATQAYKNWKAKQTDGITETSVKAWMADYLTSKKAISGKAYAITVEAAVSNTREKPYKVENVKNENGKRDFDKAYHLIDVKTGELLLTVGTTNGKIEKKIYETDEDGNVILDAEGNKIVKEVVKVDGKIRPTKTVANEKAKELMVKGHRGDIRIDEIRSTNNPTVSYVRYTPSKNAKVGTYLVFGIEKA